MAKSMTKVFWMLLLLYPATAWAHGKLKASMPVANSTVTGPVRELRLDFSEAPEIAITSVILLGPDGRAVPTSSPAYVTDSATGSKTVLRRSIIVIIQGVTLPGLYTVKWKFAGQDGHPVSGKFVFTVSGITAPSSSLGDSHHISTAGNGMGGETGGFDAGSSVYVIIRWAQFVGLLILIGAIAFHYLVLGFLRRKEHPDSPLLPLARNRAARFARWAAIGLGIIALLRLYAQSYAMHGADNAFNPAYLWMMITQTVWGWGWLVQIVGVVCAALGLAMASQGKGEQGTHRSRLGWTIAALGVILLSFTPALSGHALSAPSLTGLAVLADAVHIIGAGGWLGSLLFVVAVGIPAALSLGAEARGVSVANLVNAFSPTALVFAGIAGATGVFAAWLHLGTVPALWQTQYGRILLLKLGVLSIVAGTGAYNWLRVKPALGNEMGTRRIQRSATVELIIGAIVLAVTAVLVATPTAMDM